MSRWNKNNRFPQTVVPLDNLLREKENKTVAIGTVMKWGDCKFTSIRSSCYNMGALSSTSPIQNSAESPPENEFDNKITVEQVPKPRKFFKSRNSAPSTEVIAQHQQQQQIQSPPSNYSQHHQNSYQNHIQPEIYHPNTHIQPQSSGDEDHHQIYQHKQQTSERGKKKATVRKAKIEKPPKPTKPKKEKKVKEVVVKPARQVVVQQEQQQHYDDEDEEEESPTRRGRNNSAEGTRSSGRTRAKCVNYNEDADEADFMKRIERRVAPKRLLQVPATLTSPSTSTIENQQTAVTSDESHLAHPPIVLRISKGTSRLVSTDNEESVVKSPSKSSEDENKTHQPSNALATTDELIAVLSGEEPRPKTEITQPEPEKLKIRIKKDYIRSYNDSLKEQEAPQAPPLIEESSPPSQPPTSETRTTRRRGRQPKVDSPKVSDFDSQSSIVGSENTASSVVVETPAETSSEIEDKSSPQKGRRGRKKAAEELKPPQEPARKTRNTRKAPAMEVETVVEAPPVVVQEKPVTSRSTRNTRKNEIIEEKPVEEVKPAAPPTRKFFNRKRKNQEDEAPVNTESANDQASALNLSQKSSESLKVEPPASSPVPEYKHKKLVKRSWEQEKSQPLTSAEVDAKSMNNNNTTGPASNEQGMKLLISKKKGSIFKSRAMEKEDDSDRKRKLYKHKWDEDDELNGEEKKKETNNAASEFEGEASNSKKETSSAIDEYDEFDDNADSKCEKAEKFYVRNVKKAHQIQEIGEAQEMDDDVDYLLDALQTNKSLTTRCLSALQLASKCMTPAFRMHIRAQGIVSKFFKALEDSPNDPSLGLCTAMVMFALSQDTLKMDLDRPSLELMLNLLECEDSNKNYPNDNKQHLERKQKVRELCEEIQSQQKNFHLNLDNITAAQLAMDSLLSLTSKRAGEWLKEDLRELGGIEHIIKTVCECCNQISDYVETWTDPLLQKLNKIERCLRILENITSNNEANQKYVLHYKSQLFVKSLSKLFRLLYTELSIYPTDERTPKEPKTPGIAIREALVPLLKVLINLTHPFNDRAIGSVFFGDHSEVFDSALHLLLFGPNHIPKRQQFDLSVLTLVLLNNLAQSNEKNRQTIMQSNVSIEEFGKEKQPAMKALVEFCYKYEDSAKLIKKMTDEMLDDAPKTSDAKQKSMDDAANAVIQSSDSHMEHSILASVTSILIGFVVMNNQSNEESVRKYLRDGKFTEMVTTLMQYYEFLDLTVSSEASQLAQLKTIKNVIDYMKQSDEK